MKIQKTHLLAMSLIGCIATMGMPVHAETVNMPGADSRDEGRRQIYKPERGMSKSQVEAVFGAPESRHGPTGDPAIYYWEYEDFTVYFESDYVLHAVSKHKKLERPAS